MVALCVGMGSSGSGCSRLRLRKTTLTGWLIENFAREVPLLCIGGASSWPDTVVLPIFL